MVDSFSAPDAPFLSKSLICAHKSEVRPCCGQHAGSVFRSAGAKCDGMDGASAKQVATTSRASNAACTMPVFVGEQTSSRTRRTQGGMGGPPLGFLSPRVAWHLSRLTTRVPWFGWFVFQTRLPERSWRPAASAVATIYADEGFSIGSGTASKHVSCTNKRDNPKLWAMISWEVLRSNLTIDLW